MFTRRTPEEWPSLKNTKIGGVRAGNPPNSLWWGRIQHPDWGAGRRSLHSLSTVYYKVMEGESLLELLASGSSQRICIS